MTERNSRSWLPLTATVFIGLLASVALEAQPAATPVAPLAEWTVLIFMNGDNNLEPDALLNFKQLAKVGGNSQVNIIVQFDRIAKYAHTAPDWAQTLRFQIKQGTRPLPADALEDIGEADMGDPAVLRDFVTWGQSHFPAKRTMLIIWDHGQGWRLFLANMLKRQRALVKSRAFAAADGPANQRASAALLRNAEGVAVPEGKTAPFRSAPGDAYRSASNDETNNDVLYDREIEDGLKEALNGHRLDVIGFDACLMAMVETSYALRDVGQYFVGSEELEPGEGWKYDDWLSGLIAHPTQDAVTLARNTVAAYQIAYPDTSDEGPETTLSAIDLGQAPALASKLSELSDYLSTKLDVELQSIIEARSATSTYAPGYLFYHVDLAQFLTELAKRTHDSALNTKIQAVLALISSAVLANHAGSDRQGSYGSHGLAIYFPSNERDHIGDPYAEGGYEKDNQSYPVEFVKNERWTDFLHAYWARVP